MENYTVKDISSVLALSVLNSVKSKEKEEGVYSLNYEEIYKHFMDIVEAALEEEKGREFLAGTLAVITAEYIKDKTINEILKDFNQAKAKINTLNRR